MPEPGTSWDTPILFDDVEEFLAYIGDSNNAGKYVSLSDPHIQNGQFVGSGNGTENNPYVVSTYREMLLVTGATRVYECKLMDDDQDLTDFTQSRRYWYNSGEPNAQTVYCLYDPTPTLVNCSRIWPTPRNTIYNYGGADFNGWTLMNLVVTTNNSKWAGFISSSGSTAYARSRIVRRAIFGNAKCNLPDYPDIGIINCDLEDCMIQLDVDAAMNTRATYITYQYIIGGNLNRVTMHFKYTGSSTNTLYPSGGNDDDYCPRWWDSIVDFDIDVGKIGLTYGYAYIRPTRCTMKGTIKYYNRQGSSRFFRYASDTIFDHQEISGTGSMASLPDGCGRCVYNKNKLTHWTDTANCLMGVTTAELLQPEVLQQKGLSIGVDT